MKDLLIALESSCDDSSISVFSQNKILYENTLNQNTIVKNYGGVFPEIVARNHLGNFLKMFFDLDYRIKDWKNRIKRICYTGNPGFIGSLVISKCIAETFSLVFFNNVETINVTEIMNMYDEQKIQLIKVNHLHGHIFSPFILEPPTFPYISAIISGGHTIIFKVNSVNDIVVLSKTRDDAIGEAYDKVGRLLGVDFPWGQNIDRIAGCSLCNCLEEFSLKSPLLEDGSLSFSGIKTKIAMILNKKKLSKDKKIKLLREFQKKTQEAIYNICIDVAKKEGIKTIGLGGGVACNSYLRKLMRSNKNINCHFPKICHCTDNATMIGNVVWQHLNTLKLMKLNKSNL